MSSLIFRAGSLVTILLSHWFQVLVIRRIASLNDRSLRRFKAFMPSIAAVGLVVNWAHFVLTFLETGIIKHILSMPEVAIDYRALVCHICTEMFYPFDYLLAFTAAGCWMEILLRYAQVGTFEIGRPVSDTINDMDVHSNIVHAQNNVEKVHV
ncbi:Protein F55G1.15 [Aphelenchoides avenae]|nr:Protein F55G1.15 [Aphelenchus avenae]